MKKIVSAEFPKKQASGQKKYLIYSAALVNPTQSKNQTGVTTMNNSEIKQLQKIIMGHDYDEAIINKAIAIADIVDQDSAAIHLANRSTLLEVILCLKALRAGRDSFNSRMLLQDYVCRLQRGKANADREIKRLAPLTQSQKQTIYDHELKHELIFSNGGLHSRPSKFRKLSGE